MWVRLRGKNASPIWGGKGIPKVYFTVTVTFEVIAGL